MDFKTQLVNEIVNNLKIDQGVFSIGMIEDSIDGIKPEQYKDFFNELMGDEHNYLKPLDRVAKVSKRFKHTRSDELFGEAPTMAKACYDKFYTVNASMTTYSQENRDKAPNDREFFMNMDYSNMVDIAGQKIFNDQDIYVLNQLGGGEWLMHIKFIVNSKDAVEKIENIIRTAITKKHLTPKHEAISNKIKGLLK